MQKDRNVRFGKQASDEQIESALKEHKKKVGEVVHVTISDRTTFEFPAHLSQEERDLRIENYKKRHKPMI